MRLDRTLFVGAGALVVAVACGDEEHAKQASWVIEQVTMLDGNRTDAKVTPSPENQSIRQIG